jgi:CheY-like chemotaxis protein
VLMDVQMPVMDGIQATKLIRDLAAPAGTTPIVGLTASIMPEEYKSCLDAGMNAVLAKPVDWEQLYQALHELAAEDEEPQGDRHPMGNDSHP